MWSDSLVLYVYLGPQSIVIPDNVNMLTLGLVWNVSFGKKGQYINRSLNNHDKDNSMVKVQEQVLTTPQ